MSVEVVPFGKYKGQPAEVLLADQDYCGWLLAQPWVRERFPTVHQVIVNYGAEPQDSPEHNAMQAAFLDDERCLRLARLVCPRVDFGWDGAEKEARRRVDVAALLDRYSDHVKATFTDPWATKRFEQDGWDVVVRVHGAEVTFETVSLPPCTCGPCDCPGYHHGPKRQLPDLGTERRDFRRADHCAEGCPWTVQGGAVWLLGKPDYPQGYDEPGRIFEASDAVLLVEIKPDLGDDFPAVLRQVLRYPHERGERRVVIARRHRFEHVTWDQVREMFSSSGVTLIAEAELGADQ